MIRIVRLPQGRLGGSARTYVLMPPFAGDLTWHEGTRVARCYAFSQARLDNEGRLDSQLAAAATAAGRLETAARLDARLAAHVRTGARTTSEQVMG